jgi:hypothetical protein
MRHHLNSLAGAVLGASALLIASTAQAAESGAGFYLLGSKGPGAALLPPPGVFFSKDMYYYSGSLGGNLKLPTTGGKLAVGVDGNAFIVLPTVLWVLPEDIGGAHAALALTLPYGWKKTSAGVTFDGPLLGHRETGVSDSVFTYGDPVVTGMLGWQTGNFHWQAGTMINVPIGDYQKDEISNIAFNHWGADVFAAATYFDPATGWDFSNVVGMTFNAENPATDYRTGNEFHYETAISKQFNEKFSAGILGYYYDQLTGDSGDGARSAFKGRVAALGATVAWNFKFGDVPVSARLKYFHEFAAENRAEGDAVFATISMPLYVYPPVKN